VVGVSRRTGLHAANFPRKKMAEHGMNQKQRQLFGYIPHFIVVGSSRPSFEEGQAKSQRGAFHSRK
jgi:hypothetical protein